MLGGNPEPTSPAGTNLLYAGEHFDTDSQNYYLRARWYDSLSGRFNRMDPFAGSPQDPQSLHKYLYVHNNPVNGIDPSGRIFSNLVYGRIVHEEIGYDFENSGFDRLSNWRINNILNVNLTLWAISSVTTSPLRHRRRTSA